ncbi:MAG: molybdate ABC transporter substrate-binding protein [Sneathiella sp.]|nr:molybdate ABC transporter substrate-binding protein [Sneathiella sp.]
MKIFSGFNTFYLFGLLISFSSNASAETAKIAVASNFTGAAHELQHAFEAKTSHKLLLSFGSTGKLTTQILYGAPYAAFLAADLSHPEKIAAAELAKPGTLFTYASGELVLFRKPNSGNGRELSIVDALKSAKRIAIANPASAPYGQAAYSVLTHLDMWEAAQSKLVRGGNIAQTYQFAITGNVDLAFVAKSQVIKNKPSTYWSLPKETYPPLKQGAILLTKGQENKAAIEFLDFLKTEPALEIISSHGYDRRE